MSRSPTITASSTAVKRSPSSCGSRSASRSRHVSFSTSEYRAMVDRYDVVIIGAGPGGYVAAIRAAQLGLKTACVESRGSLGGTCLNIGCIPSKALLQSSHKFAEVGRELAEHGVRVGEVELDLAAMMSRKDKVVTTLTRGVEFLFRKNKIDWLKGKGRIAVPGRIVVTGADGASQEIEANSIIIASGSES